MAIKPGTLPITVSSVAFLVIMTFVGCEFQAQQKATAEARAARQRAEHAEAHLQAAEKSASEASLETKLVHIVWFKLPDEQSDAKVKELIDQLNTLNGIEQVHALEIGRFHDLGDPRAMSEYGVVMSMRFESEADYQTYQQHPIHLQLKTNVKKFLAGPPATYDYWSE